MKERPRPTSERAGQSPRGFQTPPPAAAGRKKTKGLNYRQQRQLVSLVLVATGLLVFGLAWVMRSSATLPDLVPLLNLPTASPAPTQMVALAPSPTTTSIA